MKRARDFRREAWNALGEGQYWPFVVASCDGLMSVCSLNLARDRFAASENHGNLSRDCPQTPEILV
jgi:hypothetical protein